MNPRRTVRDNRGSALFLVLGYLAVVTIFATTFLTGINSAATQATRAEREQVCFALAEAGIDKALAELRANSDTYRGEQATLFGEGRFSVEVTGGGRPGTYRVASEAELRGGGHVLCRARVAAFLTFGPDGQVTSLKWEEVKR